MTKEILEDWEYTADSDTPSGILFNEQDWKQLFLNK